MDIGLGGARYNILLAQCREQGTIAIEKGSLGWKYPKAKKAKADKSAKRGRERVKKDITPAGPDLFTLCEAVEAGEKGIEVLIPFTGKGLTIQDILNWHVQEGMARDIAEIRTNNGGW